MKHIYPEPFLTSWPMPLSFKDLLRSFFQNKLQKRKKNRMTIFSAREQETSRKEKNALGSFLMLFTNPLP